MNDDSDDERFDLDRIARAWSWAQLGGGIVAGVVALFVVYGIWWR